MKTLFLTALMALLPLTVFAMDSVSVNKGDTIPTNLELQDQNGEAQSFDTLKGTKGLTLVFVRSLDWCPYCQAQTIELNDRAGEFEQAGYPIVTVSYDSVAKLDQFAKKRDIEIATLSDPASDSIKAFGILNEDHALGTFAYGVPHPGVYIIGADKTVQAKFFEDGYKDRPDVDVMLEEIKGIGSF